MTEPMSPEEKASLLDGFTGEVLSGHLSASQKAIKEAEAQRALGKRQFHDKEGSHPPVRGPKYAVYRPTNMFAKGRVDRGAQEEQY